LQVSSKFVFHLALLAYRVGYTFRRAKNLLIEAFNSPTGPKPWCEKTPSPPETALDNAYPQAGFQCPMYVEAFRPAFTLGI
ncbi:hypothetical protein, partial [Enterococcus faecalis]|uniref:hypothetical protein n=1 Tax=Enterococcus faecalis TaxID=1351 RepID=UPI003CC5A29B